LGERGPICLLGGWVGGLLLSREKEGACLSPSAKDHP
jgi:hypothetical protein